MRNSKIKIVYRDSEFQNALAPRKYTWVRRHVALIIPVIAALFLSAVPRSAGAADGGPTPAERELMDSLNNERALQHLAALKWDSALANTARLHSDRMAQERNISHQFPGEPDLSARAILSGVRFSKIAENVGEGPYLLEIHSFWMHSPGHRANILNSNMDSIGIGVTERDSQFYATQDFSRAIQSLTFDEQERRFGALLQAEGFRLERSPAEARKACESGHADATKIRAVYEFHYVTSDLSTLPKKIEDTIRLGQYHIAAVGACGGGEETRSGMYRLAVLLY